MEFKRISHDDLSFLNEVRNECIEYLHDSRTFTLEETTKWFNKTNPDFWIIWHDNQRIGYFRTSNHSVENKNIYIGADLHKDFRGKNLGWQAYMEFIPILFDKLDLHKISLEVLENNHRAKNLYKKLGFEEEGVKREEVFKEGEWVNSVIMSLLRKSIWEK